MHLKIGVVQNLEKNNISSRQLWLSKNESLQTFEAKIQKSK